MQLFEHRAFAHETTTRKWARIAAGALALTAAYGTQRVSTNIGRDARLLAQGRGDQIIAAPDHSEAHTVTQDLPAQVGGLVLFGGNTILMAGIASGVVAKRQHGPQQPGLAPATTVHNQ